MAGNRDKEGGRKHRRMQSNEYSRPPIAHRRIDSLGGVASIRRPDGGSDDDHTADSPGTSPVPFPAVSQQPPPRAQHHRDNSLGLDILSAVAEANTDDLAVLNRDAANSDPGSPQVPSAVSFSDRRASWSDSHRPSNASTSSVTTSRASLSHLSTGSYESGNTAHPMPPPGYRYHPEAEGGPNSMAPPAHRRSLALSSGSSYPVQHSTFPPGTYVYPNHGHYPPPGHPYFPGYLVAPGSHDVHGPYTHYSQPYSVASTPGYPVQQHGQYYPDERGGPSLKRESPPPPRSQGSQTFVTGLAMDHGNKTLTPSHLRRTSHEYGRGPGSHPLHGPMPPGSHHRKMSSFSSLGVSGTAQLFLTVLAFLTTLILLLFCLHSQCWDPHCFLVRLITL
jgi:hypothetical protein